MRWLTLAVFVLGACGGAGGEPGGQAGQGGGGHGGAGGEPWCQQVPDCVEEISREPCSQTTGICATAICNSEGRCEAISRNPDDVAWSILYFRTAWDHGAHVFSRTAELRSFTASIYSADTAPHRPSCDAYRAGTVRGQSLVGRQSDGISEPTLTNGGSIYDLPEGHLVTVLFDFYDGPIKSQNDGPVTATGEIIGRSCVREFYVDDDEQFRRQVMDVRIEDLP